MHMVNPGSKVCKIQNGKCVATFSTVVDNAVIVRHLSHTNPSTESISTKKELATKRDAIARRLANGADLTVNQQHWLCKKLHDHSNFFSIDGELGRTSVMEHAIPTQDATPGHQQPRRVPFNHLKK